jgi:hypothetical protein
VNEAEHPRNQENQKNRAYTDACPTARTPASVAIISTAASQQEDQNDDENQKHTSPFEFARLTASALELLALLDHVIAGLPARFFGFGGRFRRDRLAGVSDFVNGLFQVGRRIVNPLLYVFPVETHVVVLLGFFGSLETYRHVVRNRAVWYFQA